METGIIIFLVIIIIELYLAIKQLGQLNQHFKRLNRKRFLKVVSEEPNLYVQKSKGKKRTKKLQLKNENKISSTT